MTAWRQHGMSTLPSSPRSSAARMSSSPSPKSPYLRASVDRHALDLRHARKRFAHLLGDAEVERERHPLVGVVLEFGDRRILEPRLDRQQADRRRPRRVVQELGRAHRRAARRRRQQPLAEIGEEDRVDQLGLAARELGDERDDELVLVQALEQLLHLEVDLGVGQVLLLQPFVQPRNAGRTAAGASRCRLRNGPRDRGTGPCAPWSMRRLRRRRCRARNSSMRVVKHNSCRSAALRRLAILAPCAATPARRAATASQLTRDRQGMPMRVASCGRRRQRWQCGQ